jgi:hypothetical protein
VIFNDLLKYSLKCAEIMILPQKLSIVTHQVSSNQKLFSDLNPNINSEKKLDSDVDIKVGSIFALCKLGR